MKTNIIKWIANIALAMGISLVFVQCEKSELGFPFNDGGPALLGNGDNASALGSVQMMNRDVNANYGDACQCISNIETGELSEQEIQSLVFMREEEKLARDVYLKLYESWNADIFLNISNSEVRHMDAVLCLIERYDLEDPVGMNEVGVFQNAALQELYFDLVEAGAESLEAALRVGATIEDLDIRDLLQYMNDEAIDNGDIMAVYENLLRGSRNHLRAFVRNLEIIGSDYEAQYISSEEYEAIISSDWERGLNFGQGQGVQGRGKNGNSGTCDGTRPNRF
jgi:hypothetical protein